jgi:nitrate reductase molybdenum cofactor assembly chaperone NarJ/NarW
MRHAVRRLAPAQLSLAWQSASLLLGYPDHELLDRLDLIRRASRELPDPVGVPLRSVAGRLAETPLPTLEADYVETFDSRRRHNLFLTYFAHGDTRKRGVALLRFKQTYLDSGFELTDEELPDHLCVVLEYAATIDQARGRQLILDHRAGLELLRISLSEADSRWAGAVEAVTATLPALRGDEMDAVRRLAAEGPPAEEVGLTPYATPGFDPGPARPDPSDHSGPVLLPMPSFPGSH